MAEVTVAEAIGSSTPEPAAAATSESQVTPEIQQAHAAVFGDSGESAGQGESKPSGGDTSRSRAAGSEAREELEGLDGVSSTDDGEEDFGGSRDEDQKADDVEPKPSRDTDGTKEDGGGSDAPTLNPILRQAARRSGWTDEQVDEFFEKDEEFALQTFRRLSVSVNDLTSQYARLGQARQQYGPSPASAAPPRVPAARGQRQQDEADDDLIREIYDGPTLESLEKELGEDVVGKLLAPLLKPIRSLFADAESRQADAVAAEVGKFFSDLPGEFDGLYGKGDQVSGEQTQARGRLAEMADRVRAGAASQGLDLTVGDALEQANMVIAGEYIGELERKRLTARVQKRSRQRTHRPSQGSRRRGVEAGGRTGEKSTDAAIAKATDMFAELGIR